MPMTIYPNPASSQFTIALKSSSNQASTVSLIDLSGKQVFYSSAAAGSSQVQVVLNGKIAPGVYIVRLNSSNETLFSKIISADLTPTLLIQSVSGEVDLFFYSTRRRFSNRFLFCARQYRTGVCA